MEFISSVSKLEIGNVSDVGSGWCVGVSTETVVPSPSDDDRSVGVWSAGIVKCRKKNENISEDKNRCQIKGLSIRKH